MVKRTHTCGEITLDEVGSKVCLNGWIGKTRDLGGLIFIAGIWFNLKAF